MKPLLLLPLFILSNFIQGQDIFRTACQGNLERLEEMLQEESIEGKDNRGRTLIHWAVGCGKDEVLDYLIGKDADINSKDFQGKTAMFVALDYENREHFEKLISEQPDDSWINDFGGELISEAVLRDNKGFIEILLESGVDIDQKNSKGNTGFELASNLGNDSLATWLNGKGSEPSEKPKVNPKGKYMGQKEPGTKPKVFAPNFISTEEYEFGSVFNRAGDEFYYGVDVLGKSEIRFSKMVNGQWTDPITIFSHSQYGYNDPYLSNDESELYYISNQPLSGTGDPKDIDIWYSTKTSEGWSAPINAGSNINTDREEYYISFDKDGTMFFGSGRPHPDDSNGSLDIYYAETGTNQKFANAYRLGDAINTPEYEADVYIAPDQSYMIFCSSRSSSLGRGDLYISFKDEGGKWSQAQNMGKDINTKNHELCPFVTPDGKFLFYTSNEDIYWVSTKILDKYRK